MNKVSLIIALSFGLLAFSQPNKGKSENSDKNSNSKNSSVTKGKNSSKNDVVFDQKQQGKKSDNEKKSDNGNNSNSKNNKNYNKDKGNHNVSKHDNKNHNSKNDGNHKMKKYKKGHPNFNYVFVNDHGYYSHKNYGQWRSEQARNKHKNYRPKYEYEAIEGFKLIDARNEFLFNETDYKINLLKTRLVEKRDSNQITALQYDTYNNKIEVLEERRSGLNININL
jgi:hypothetical protein